MSVVLPKTVQEGLQLQMNRELVSMVVYKQARMDMKLLGWIGFHKYFHCMENEEKGHSSKFGHYLVERNVRPIYASLNVPQLAFSENPIDYFKKFLTLMNEYTEYINELYKLAEDEDDYDTCVFLDYFVEEQHDGAAEYNKIVKQLTRAGSDNAALLELDEKLGK